MNEGRDLGETERVNRFTFYDHTKIYTAAPPDVLRVDEKHLREYYVFNVLGFLLTTNYKTDGIYLPPDDRRHYVAWSNLKKEDFTPNTGTRFGAGITPAVSSTLPLISPNLISQALIQRHRRRRRRRSGKLSA